MKVRDHMGMPYEKEDTQTDILLYISCNTDSDGTFYEEKIRQNAGSGKYGCHSAEGGTGRRTAA